ncbi:uncharacterized protein LOC112024309 isoform X3 [Quercus suber]|uniref:uncharacterized protein LOC112024309 isoform X3 n=1 Tax=Quercus suber TaxID=58331 RepID=UPI0032DF1C81
MKKLSLIMAFLISCWFIIESVIIPDGFRKWFCLSFFINPFVLFICQIFLWFKLLREWLLFILPLITSFLGLCNFILFRSGLSDFFSFTRLNTAEVVEEDEYFETLQGFNQNQNFDSYMCSSLATIPCKLTIYNIEMYKLEEKNDYEDSILHEDERSEETMFDLDEDTSINEYLSSICSFDSSVEEVNSRDCMSSSSSSDLPATYLDMDEHWSSNCDSNSPVIAREVTNGRDKEESDTFYKNYAERMRWFDILNYDRTCGIILNKQLESPNSLERIEQVDFSVSHIPCSTKVRKKLLRSLESDFELVYVAQSCLSWEALHHQYKKVKSLASSSSQNCNLHSNVAGAFQKFLVLLERFMEDERCGGKRVWNYVQGRFSLKSLLQVPEVLGFLDVEKEEVKAETLNIKEVLKVIEQCIQAFWEFLETDNRKSWSKFSRLLGINPPVEDPRSLHLLADLTKRLQKKELWLKHLQGEKRCCLKKVVNPPKESQKMEILCTMIDMKLVSRVLQMPLVTTSQLQWCKQKIDNIEFKEGIIIRACTGPLFPP